MKQNLIKTIGASRNYSEPRRRSINGVLYAGVELLNKEKSQVLDKISLIRSSSEKLTENQQKAIKYCNEVAISSLHNHDFELFEFFATSYNANPQLNEILFIKEALSSPSKTPSISHYAAFQGRKYIECLITNFPGVNFHNIQDEIGNTILHYANNIETIDYLISKGFDINKPNKKGQTLIDIIANENRPDKLILLKHCVERGGYWGTADTLTKIFPALDKDLKKVYKEIPRYTTSLIKELENIERQLKLPTVKAALAEYRAKLQFYQKPENLAMTPGILSDLKKDINAINILIELREGGVPSTVQQLTSNIQDICNGAMPAHDLKMAMAKSLQSNPVAQNTYSSKNKNFIQNLEKISNYTQAVIIAKEIEGLSKQLDQLFESISFPTVKKKLAESKEKLNIYKDKEMFANISSPLENLKKDAKDLTFLINIIPPSEISSKVLAHVDNLIKICDKATPAPNIISNEQKQKIGILEKAHTHLKSKGFLQELLDLVKNLINNIKNITSSELSTSHSKEQARRSSPIER